MERWDDAVDAAGKAIVLSPGLSDYTALSTPFYLATYDLDEVEWLYGSSSINLSSGLTTLGFSPSADLLSRYDPADKRLQFWFVLSSKRITKANIPSVRPSCAIRVSEALLNRAEAITRQENGDLAAALADLNLLRRNRVTGYANVNITDRQLLRAEILLERRLELCFEVHRWFDLRRLGMPAISHRYRDSNASPWATYTLNERDPLYTLPIPNDMIEHNNALRQNESAYGPERTASSL
jgi:hypothetical protein